MGQTMNLKWKFVLLSYPFDEGGESKVRPGLCLINPIGRFSHVVVAYVSSQIPPELETFDLILEPEDLVATGLKKRSVLRLHRVFTADALIMQRTLGRLPDALIPQVEIKLRGLFGL